VKQIRSPKDLAINGADPAFDEPLHVGRPNVPDHQAFVGRVLDILGKNWLTNNGPTVQEFERQIAGRLGVKHCIAVCNGTIALEIAVRALGLSGEVIVPAWTFIATAHALHWQGITPVFADVDERTHNLDPAAVRRMITPRTTGIIGVHLWGRAAPVEALQKIADEHGLQLLFDAAHAFGSTSNGIPIGRFGRCEVFSFHGTKAFNSMEGGAIATNDDNLAEVVQLMRNFGFKGYDNVIHPGTNGKMIEVCAAMGLANLSGLKVIFEANARNHAVYKSRLDKIPGLGILDYDPSEENSHHYVVLEVGEGFPLSRDDLVDALHAENVLARKYFWPGCHRMLPYRALFPHAGMLLASTERLSEKVVILPNGLATSADQVDVICDVIQQLAEGVAFG
jgi:dTDP-4-amino-4,6-dideoxygalactose transaminase